MEENKKLTTDPTKEYREVDPTDDDTTNLKDDGSTDARNIEQENLDQNKRPDAHIGVVAGQVDERMAEAAAQIKKDHMDETNERGAEFRGTDTRTPDGYREP
ncbi:hypothetical protein B9G55_16210 [Saccharibacillus sp. O16]|nr:hypothetical protein B9G55_16210 [Saccharibacillus sp. O16]